MKFPLHLVNSYVRDVVPYSSARSLVESEVEGMIYLDANESGKTAQEGEEKLKLNRYPGPRPGELFRYLADYYGVQPENLLVDRGSDGIIDLILRTFCTPLKDQILIHPPTYGVYSVFAKSMGVGVVEVPLKAEDFTLDMEKIEAAFAQRGQSIKVFFVCSPNNPTGNSFSEESLDRLLNFLEGKAICVIDEAYFEYVGKGKVSFINKINQYPHLVVLRTLSKAFGLAGVRCGVGLANAEFINWCRKVQAPYPIDKFVEEHVVRHFIVPGLIADRKANIRETVALREDMVDFLQRLALVEKVYESDANYLLIRVADAEKLVADLLQKKIVVRSMKNHYGLKYCVRITMGTKEELAVLKRSLLELDLPK